SRGLVLSRGFDVFADAFESETGRATVLTPGTYAAAVAPETFVLRRDRPGGPAAAALDRATEVYEGKARACRGRLDARTARRARAASMLESAFNALLED
ncbi:MAG: argininosuccinate lyase, partial [Boseongicola sp.]|nr:argininosuccinate lyase [Boseongicola sp.]